MIGKNAKWITCDKEISAPVVFKKIRINGLKQAVISICGLGFYELFINGRRVGENYYKPVFSDYGKRDFTKWLYPLPDETSHTVYYDTWDITEYLQEGENVFAVLLGNGYYRQTRRTVEGEVAFSDALILAFELALETKLGKTRVCTDGTEGYKASFIKENNLFFGETHDYTNISEKFWTDTSGLSSVKTAIKPDGVLRKNKCPMDKTVRVLRPKILCEKDGKTLFDAGENITGNVTFTAVDGCVKIRHAENITDDALDFRSCGGEQQIYQCEYRALKRGQKVSPWFSWGGFRYFEVEGKIQEVAVEVIHADVSRQAFFRCGNDTLNWLHEAYIRTQLNNMHCGVPMDCPHRERLGYTGDGQLTAETAMLTLAEKEFYKKWIRDIVDCQDKKTGHVQHTAPVCGGGGGPGGWGGAIVLVPYAYYKTYGDKALIKRVLPNMYSYLACVKSFCENGLVVKEREGGWCLGDWCTPDKVILPEPFVNTYYYIVCMERATELSKAVGAAVDYSAEIAVCKKALQDAYYDERENSYCKGVQGANAFALSLGVGNAEMEKSMLAYYQNRGTVDTGIFGTDILFEYLVKKGHLQLVYDLLTAQEYPSFGYMQHNGATTLWETWKGEQSHDHPMFGAAVRQLYYGFLGIRLQEHGKSVLVVPPPYLEGVGFVEGNVRTKYGKSVFVRHEFKDGKVLSVVKNAKLVMEK